MVEKYHGVNDIWVGILLTKCFRDKNGVRQKGISSRKMALVKIWKWRTALGKSLGWCEYTLSWGELRDVVKNILVAHAYQPNNSDLLYYPFDFMDH